ncbi:MAG TPA: excinuclease ABC subunit UvrA [Longimicrobiales bacterium]|nr:excinuclease ABC subunit UvrA [Longimicrobiales bacterium]
MKDRITIRNARQHNLKGFDLEIPHRKLVVVTGPSGSGKSSLAFDTIYAEGQRRYVESLSTYAKQFLERMEKPAVDSVEGIAPAVAIEQKNPTKTSRSTVGTATEVHDYLRLLWARAGRTHCPECGGEVRPDTVQSATDAVLALPEGTRIIVAFPLPLSARAGHRIVVENLREMGFVRVLAGGDTVTLDEPGAEDPERLGHDLAKEPRVLVVVDRLKVEPGVRERLADSMGTSFGEGEGEAVVVVHDDAGPRHLGFSERFRCERHPDIPFLDPTPRLFSFNNPYGSCQTCTGFGAVLEYDESLIVPVPTRTLREGAIDPWEVKRYRRKYRTRLFEFAKQRGVDLDTRWLDLPERFRRHVIRGVRRKARERSFQGVVPFLRSRERKRYKAYIRVFLRKYQLARTCGECGGARLRPEALWVRVGGRHIGEVSGMTIGQARAWFTGLTAAGDGHGLRESEAALAGPILREIEARLSFLDDVGLGYLSLDRQVRTLSGGEAQRISLANSLGSSLVDTLYVLDEPTIGLHPRDNQRLITLLEKLRDAGNTVLVVEHDPELIRRADHVVELGPGSGEKGGEVVFQGSVQELEGGSTSTSTSGPTPTGLYLSGRLEAPRSRERAVDGARLEVRGARLHNLDGVDVSIPLHTLTVVTGVSGSGKSTLVHDILYRALERELEGSHSAKEHLGEAVGRYASLEGAGYLDAVVLVDQSPIGRTPRSNPATYTKAFDEVRRIFAEQPLARERKYRPGRFSFNTKGGRCEACKGDGVVQVEMVFMADVYVPCDRCGGARYAPETLEVKVKGLSIRDVLDLTIDEAIRFFIREDRLGKMLWQLQQVGLGYLRLGQAAPTLSGGEAQRMKIARELAGAGKKRGKRLYIMDEPTTGLSGPEVHKLLAVLQKLVDAGHTVLVIEHNLDVIRAADWVIDMGPEAGAGGGTVVAAGRPADVAAEASSHTGAYLRPLLAGTRTA